MSLQLARNAFHGRRSGPVVMVVMDGFGLGPDYPGNAVQAARTPTIDALMAKCPWLSLKAHGTAVGLPSDADMGNSEVGHNAMGAGRVFDQGAKLVANAIEDRSMFGLPAWNEIVGNVLTTGGTLHCIGLCSDGNVHSHLDHLKAMCVEAKARGVKRLAVHALLDGRDVGETTALDYIEPLEAFLAELSPDYGIASGGGRMLITMDRYDADWSMVERGWKIHVRGEGPRFPSASAAIGAARAAKAGIVDQDLPGFVIERDGQPFAPIVDGDSVIFFNFRGDRAIELSKALLGCEVPFERGPVPRIEYAGMMQYDGDTGLPPRFLVQPPALDRTMGEYLAAAGVAQLAVSETQKYGHVTYFWNGNRSGCFDPKLEDYLEVTSDLGGFDIRPWMKAVEITDLAIKRMQQRNYGFVRINYPNGDMVGHTGDFEAARIGVEVVDRNLARLLPVIERLGGIMLLTADHGNADEMYERSKDGSVKMENGRPKAKTAHTLNPVPFIVYDPACTGEYTISAEGIPAPGIANSAATALNLCGFAAPADYEPSLVRWAK